MAPAFVRGHGFLTGESLNKAVLIYLCFHLVGSASGARGAGAGRILGRVRQHVDLDAAILLAILPGIVGSDFLVLADANEVEAAGGDVVLGGEVLHHGVRATLAEVVVVVVGADRVGSSSDFEDVVFGTRQLLAEGVQLVLVILGEDGLVEAEGDGDVAGGVVVVQSLDDGIEGVGTMDSIVGRSFGIAGGLGGVLRVLGGLIGGALSLLDARLGAIIHIVEAAIVLSRFFVELIGVVNQGRGLFAHVVLGGATGEARQGQRRHTQPESSFPHLFESSRRLSCGSMWVAATCLPLWVGCTSRAKRNR